jgi:hypothetical protein
MTHCLPDKRDPLPFGRSDRKATRRDGPDRPHHVHGAQPAAPDNVVFDFKVKGHIRRVVSGERVGTLVTN